MRHKKTVNGLPRNFGKECNAGLARLPDNGIGTRELRKENAREMGELRRTRLRGLGQ